MRMLCVVALCLLGPPSLSSGQCLNIDFEPDVNGLLPDGSVAVDDMPITDQYLASHGVSFGVDNDLDGMPDLGVAPVLEQVGDDAVDSFINCTLSKFDTAAPGFEPSLGIFFLRTVSGFGSTPDNMLISYAFPVSSVSAEIWDLDGTPTGTEQWRIEALDGSGAVVDSILTPNQADLTFDGKPYAFSIDHGGTADIAAIRLIYLGTKPSSSLGVAFENFQPACPTAWTDLGNSLGGTHGDPLLTGSGTLADGSPVTLDLTNALENTKALLITGASAINVPFAGGTMVPAPEFIFTGLNTNSSGGLTLSGTWPSGVPSGTTYYFQYWIFDPLGPQGFAASNAISGITP